MFDERCSLFKWKREFSDANFEIGNPWQGFPISKLVSVISSANSAASNLDINLGLVISSANSAASNKQFALDRSACAG